MLKEIIICGIVIILIIIGNYFTQNYTKECVYKITEELEQLKESIVPIELVDRKKAIEEIKQIKDNWEKKYEILAYFIEHDELEKVATNITALESLIETQEYENAVAELDKSKFVLKHIQDKYSFNLQNIF